MSIDIKKILNDFSSFIKDEKTPQKLIEKKNIFSKKFIQPLYSELKTAANDKKKEIGQKLNQLKNLVEEVFEDTKQKISISNDKNDDAPKYDLRLNTFNALKGSRNIISLITNKIIEFFKRLNFEIVMGDEIVSIENNMDRLNIPLDHPARDAKDTFYIDTKNLLRTHCTATTAEVIHDSKNEIKVLSFGNVYRNDDDDATHSHQFTQIDFVWIKKDLKINHLKTLIDNLLKYIFEDDSLKTRYRLSFFPFTEPSFEVDISCPYCKNKGCSICKNSGWIEILGAGMLHQNVLKFANIKNIKSGLAAGIGIERIAMIKYGIQDIRDIYSNDFRLINQVRMVVK